MCGLKNLASGVFPESWKLLAECRKRRRKWTKLSPPITQVDLNSVLYKAASSLALPLLNAYLLIVSGFSKVCIDDMPLLNGEIAYSSDQRKNSYIFVDLETDLDSANTLMTTSDAAKLGIRCKLLAWIRDYLVRSKANQRLGVKCQGRVSGTHGFWNGTPKPVSCRDLFSTFT